MKTRRVVGYVAVALAYASACGGSPATSIPLSATQDGGAAESGDLSGGTDATAGDDGNAPVRRSEAGAADGAAASVPNAGPDEYCCVSGAYYACPDRAALHQCQGFDIAGCFQSCPPTDATCAQSCGQKASEAQTDPSACTHDATQDALCAAMDAGLSSGSRPGAGSGPAPPAPPPTPKNACGGYFLGTACSVGGQCIGEGHCSQGKCYPNDVGNPCTFPNDCGGGNHCTNGCCASPAKGSACTAGFDCKSGTCTSGICQ